MIRYKKENGNEIISSNGAQSPAIVRPRPKKGKSPIITTHDLDENRKLRIKREGEQVDEESSR